MTNEIVQMSTEVLSSIVLNGDISKLDQKQVMEYYGYRCKQLGLDPSSQPFGILVLKGKKVLYPNKSCTEQLNKIHKISHQILSAEKLEDVYIVRVRATMPDGQFSDNSGVVSIGGLKGDDLANAIMKAETKGYRRSTLSLLGMGMTDESEIETIRGAQTIQCPITQPENIEQNTTPALTYQPTQCSPFNSLKQKEVVAQPQSSNKEAKQEVIPAKKQEEKKPVGKKPSKSLYVTIGKVTTYPTVATLVCTDISSNATVRATIFKDSNGNPNPIYDQINENIVGSKATLGGYFKDSTNAKYPEPSFIVTSFFLGQDEGIAEDVPPLNNDLDSKDEDIPF